MATSASASSSNTGDRSGVASDKSLIHPSLKFVISNYLKSLIPHPLSSKNYPIWSNQVHKLLKANGFQAFLDPDATSSMSANNQDQENQDPNLRHHRWLVTDQNLAATICATISPQILPYVVHLESTAEIWTTLQIRFQSTNRSKVIQLKNEQQNISMNNMSMTQYLTVIKKLVDQIAYAGAKLDPEDVLHHILNGLPLTYNSFKAAVRTMQTSLSLDNLYALLISEEIHVKSDASRHLAVADNQTALYTDRGR
ncbi:hypothetical protein KFK09_007626 [Dendrobium nobile]|uniref:Retrovirus-related Pol polyprotein from transposon TNT 1-94 n=1 Tax=Dendrobium nobile TaxID=94219 RepID=A0A8T3BSD9_DENNO|nr:hypothetical protein KFK09_007626 [Dendrobium nobile]